MFCKKKKTCPQSGDNALSVQKDSDRAVCESKRARKKRITSGAGVLAIGSVVAKMLGALYRIPLTNVLGAQGMGMYQLIFPVYALFMVLSTAGIPTALSRIVAEKRALGLDSRKFFATAMATLAVTGGIFSILTFALARQFAAWQGNPDTYYGFMVISPAILLVGFISGFRGWFQGEMYMIPTAISNVVEQVVKLALGISLALTLVRKGLVYAVCGALAGVALSEAVALVYMFVTYLVRSAKARRTGEYTVKERMSRDDAKSMLLIAFPIAIVAVLMPLSNFFDSVIIVNMLKIHGESLQTATAWYGLLSGPVQSLVNMPIVAIMSIAIAIVPSVSHSNAMRDADAIMLKSRLCVKTSYLLGIPFAFFFAVFAPDLLKTVYPALSEQSLALASNLLRISAFNVVAYSAMQIYVSLLQALDKTKWAVLSLVCAIIVKTVLSVVLVRYIGITGGAIASLAMGAIALLGVNIAYFKICGLHLEKNVGTNLVVGVIMALSGIGVKSLLQGGAVAVAVGALVCGAIYVWFAFLFGIVGKDDIEHLPFKKLLLWLHRRIRFWEYG